MTVHRFPQAYDDTGVGFWSDGSPVQAVRPSDDYPVFKGEVAILFALSFGAAGLMIVGAIQVAEWAIGLFR